MDKSRKPDLRANDSSATALAALIRVDRSSSRPLYLQIGEGIEAAIRVNSLKSGSRVPTVRALADALGIGRGSVAAAFDWLAQRGVLFSRVGSGSFVAEVTGRSTDADTSAWWLGLLAAEQQGLPPVHTADVQEGASVWVPESGDRRSSAVRYPMHIPLSDHRLLAPQMHAALQRLAHDFIPEWAAYEHPQGLPSLREWIAARAATYGIACTPQEVIVCNGAQQGINLVASVLLRPGDIVLTGNPTYQGALRAFRMWRAQVLGVPVSEQGMSVDALNKALNQHRPKMLFSVPTHQVPTGTTLSLEYREQICHLAGQHDFAIVEDSYVNDLFFDAPPPPPFKALDKHDRVIHIGSFSKYLGPALRLGFLIAPRALVPHLLRAKEAQDICSSALNQRLLHDVLTHIDYEQHLQALRQYYRIRYQALTECLGKGFSGLRYIEAKGGFSLWLQLSERVSARRWVALSLARDVGVGIGDAYYLGGAGRNEARLSFGLLTPDEIRAALKILSETYNDAQASVNGVSPRIYVPFA